MSNLKIFGYLENVIFILELKEKKIVKSWEICFHYKVTMSNRATTFIFFSYELVNLFLVDLTMQLETRYHYLQILY